MSEHPRPSSLAALFGRRQKVRRPAVRRRHQTTERTGLERLDERRMLAFDLVAAYADSVDPFYVKGGIPATLTVAPQQVTLKFSPEVRINAATLTDNISVLTQGGARVDVGLSVEDSPNQNQVAIRFKKTLDDGTYQIVVGAGLQTRAGDSITTKTTIAMQVNLGAFVVSVVPQPVTRQVDGTLAQARDQVHVYFNAEDPLLEASAKTAAFYRLVPVDPNTNVDGAASTPTGVTYDKNTGLATLTFAGLPTAAGLYRLEIGGGAAIAPITIAEGNEALDPSLTNSSFTTARVVGPLGAGGATITGSIQVRPTVTTPIGTLEIPVSPGTLDTPGQRDVPVDSGNHGVPPFAIVDPVTGITAVAYNFRPIIGTDPQGNLLQNVITEAQKQRAREIFELFSLGSGVRFVETPDQGLMVATGDLRAFNPNIPSGEVRGLGGTSGALMSALVNWGDSEYGGQWFRVAMHEIGHALGLQHTYDLPSIMGAELGGEPVFPGDYDFEHLRQLYPSNGSDIDVYKFTLPESGRLTAETVVARPGLPVTSRLDTVLSLYREDTVGSSTVRTLVARNDDFYGRDSFVGLDLQAGTYFIAVTSVGNTAFDPAISDSGANGRTDGDYQLKLGFTSASVASNTIVDEKNTPIDGDRDGVAGGAFKFWFNAAAQANTAYVDKANPSPGTGVLGSLTNPFRTLQAALAAVPAGGIIRIAGTAAAPYEIGTDLLGNPLKDGTTFNVPAGVTAMIDGGAVFKLRAANIDVGSSSQLVSRANAAIQVLGVPATGSFAGSQVTFTSWHDDTIGGNSDNVGPAVQGGQWGGIVLRQDSDVASKHAFVNSISGATIRYGGGQVAVDSVLDAFAPIQIESTRPTILFNSIRNSAGAGIAATPNSFEDTGDRVGPEFRGNQLTANSVNGLFIKIATQFGTPLDRLDVPARFKSTDIVYVIQENLVINGGAGGYTSTVSRLGNLTAGVTTVTGLAKTSDLRVGMQVEIRDPADPGVSALPLGQATIVSVDSPTSITLSVAPLVTAQFATITFRSTPARIDATGNVTLNSAILSNLPTTAGLTVGMRVEIVDAANPGTTLLPGGFATIVGIAGTTVTLSGAAVATRTGARVTFIDATAVPLGFARDSGRLSIDPGVVVKLQGSRIELERGIAQLVAEGLPGKPVIFTSLGDNRYGAGGTFDTNGNVPDKFDAVGQAVGTLTVGDWGGIILEAGSKASIDRSYVAFGGGGTPIEGGFDNFNVIEVHQGDLRLTNSRIENNAAGTATTNRTGRGDNAASTVFVRGSQPIIVNNDFRANVGATISINANALSDVQRGDVGRSTGAIDRFTGYDDNFGPLVRGNVLAYGTGGQATAGMVVRGGEITVESVWDDTDIVHVLQDEIIVQNFHTATGVRLLSKSDASLVVKLFGANAGFTAAGENLDIYDRIGGTVQVVGQPGYPVILTSLRDDTVGSGVDPLGRLVTDTNADGTATVTAAGDWRSLRFLPLSNDRNVTILTEREKANTGGIDANNSTVSAEWLGILAPNYATGNNTWESAQEKSGDDNRRLGFEVHGNVAYDDATDVDVYAFTGYAGSEAWIDVDKTSPALDAMVELLDASGNVLARSVDSIAEGGVIQGEIVNNAVGGTSVTYQFAPDGLTPGLTPATFSLLPGTLSGVIYDFVFAPGQPPAPTAIQTFSVDANGVFSFQSILGDDRLGVPNTVPVIGGGSGSYATGGTVNLATGQLTLTYSGTGIVASRVEVRYSYKTPALTTAVAGAGQTLGKDAWRGGDYFTQNARDPGMRVILPGTQGVQTRYYLRVRSQPRYEPAATGVNNGSVAATTDTQYRTDVSSAAVKNGATSGRYELRVRLRQQDEKPGSTVRYADIRYPTIGIDVQGLPSNSPLVADSAENPTDANDAFATAQYIGNVLESNRGAVSVAGNVSAEGDVDWYTFALNYEQIQSIPGLNDSGFSWATVFDIDYADGFRGDLTMSVFDSNGQLIYVGRDSGVTDDQPGASQGNDFDNLAAGSAGKLDPYIGTVTLGAGGPTGTGGGDSTRPVTPINPAAQTRYYVAISSNERLPSQLNATFTGAAANTVVRLEPIASVDRIITDRIGAPAARYPGVAADERMIDTATLGAYVRPFTLADVTLFVTTSTSLVTVDAMRGGVETTIASSYGTGRNIGDLVMRTDGRMYVYGGPVGDGTTAGRLEAVDAGDGTRTVLGTDGIPNRRTINDVTLGSNETGTRTSLTYTLSNPDIQPETFTANLSIQGTDAAGNTVTGTWSLQGPAVIPLGYTGPTFALTVTPVAANGQPAPNGAWLDVVNGIITRVRLTWGVPVDAANVGLGNVQYDLRQTVGQTADSDTVDAVAWRRTGLPGSGQYNDLYYAVQDDLSPGQSRLYRADPANGGAVNPTSGQAVIVNGVRYGRVGYGFIQDAAGQIGTVTGMAYVGTVLYGVDNLGHFFTINPATAVATAVVTIAGAPAFAGLTNGPQNLNGGALAGLLFAIDNGGNLRALTTAGVLQTVFDANLDGIVDDGTNGQLLTTVLATGAGAATGLAFSPLDINLWHTTTRRGGDAGGGTSPTELQSMYFGLENTTAQFGGNAAWQADLLSNPAIGNNYNLPGGAYGSMTTNAFSLAGYEYTDKPTLYFDYWLQSQDARGSVADVAMRDSARVFASLDGGLTWELLTTNNADRSAADTSGAELPNFLSASSKISNDTMIQNQHVQELYDTSNWRQARVDLGKFAGRTNIRLRFDFSTAGKMDQTQRTIDINGDGVNDLINNIVNDTTGRYGPPTAGVANATGVFRNADAGDVTTARQRGQNNAFEGFYIDDIVIGFAERGEAVTGATAAATTFFDVLTPGPSATVAAQVLNGPYQLEIRRGTETSSVAVPDALAPAPFPETFDTNERLIGQRSNTTAYGPLLGDASQPREQGQFVIESNIVTGAAQYGIRIDAAARDVLGNIPQPGAPRNLPTLNNARLVPGVVVANNVVARSGTAGILFSGDPNTGNVPAASVPFGRIVNNTIYGGETAVGVGVQVTDNASPTLLNNLFANLAQGVTADASSAARTPVVGTSAYWNTTTQVTGASQSNQIALTANPFVNPTRNNFYLVAGTRAIDSSLDSLQDRNEFVQVNSPIGITASPILAPDRDLYGQLRSDDPGVTNLSGLGNNVFKDRGAIDRVDFAQPSAKLVNPLDGGLTDRDATADVVSLRGTDAFGVTRFELLLSDVGVGIDDSTVTSAAFAITQTRNNITKTLDEHTEYVFRYLQTSKRVVFESASVFVPGTYVIALTTRPSTGTTPGLLTDLANNTLLPNKGDGTTSFTIRLVGLPSAPTSLTGTLGSEQVALQWLAPTDNGGAAITDYVVQYSIDALTWTTFAEGTSTATTATVTGLTNGTPYYFRVAAVNEAGQGPYAQTLAPITPHIPAPAPTSLAATAGNGQVALAWIAPTGTGYGTISGYSVQYRVNGALTWTTLATGIVLNATVTPLTNGTTYQFRVAAVTEFGEGTWSAVRTATPIAAPAPLSLAAAAGDRQVALTWTAPTVVAPYSPITDYRVEYRRAVDTTWTTFADGVRTTPGATVTGLTNGTYYVFRVTSLTAAGLGGFATRVAVPVGLPAAPTGLVVTAGDGSVTARWNAATTGPATGGVALTGYRVEWRTSTGAWTGSEFTGATLTTATINGLVNNTAYLVRVAARNAQGLGAYATASAFVTPRPLPAAPTRLTARAGDGNAALAWTAPTITGGLPIVNYAVQYSTDSVNWVSLPNTGSSLARATVVVPNGRTYVFRVAAITAAGTGAFSVASPAVTPYSPTALPAAPTSLAVTNPSSRTAALTWVAPTPNPSAGGPVTGYVVQYRLATSATWVSVSTTAPSATILNLISGQSYVFRVQARNLAGLGAFTAGITRSIT